MAMKKGAWLFPAGILLILAVLLSLYALLFHQARGFTFTHHEFRPSPVSVIGLTALAFVLLLSVWVLYGRAIGARFAQPPGAVLTRDFLSFLPLLFSSLAPLTLAHFIGADDLRARLALFLAALAGGCLYLKVVALRGWSAQTASRPGKQTRPGWTALTPKKKSAALFIVALLAFNTGSLVMVSRGASFSGDEPHYLIICRSLLHDRDFDLANNYAQKDYSEYMQFHGEIAPHVVNGAEPGRLYSFHSPGVSFLLLPFYAAGSLFKGKVLVLFIRLGMSLWGALFSVQVYLLTQQLWGKESLAVSLWLFTSFSAPVFFYAIHVYPEIIVACIALLIYRLLRESRPLSGARALLCGLGLGSLIWFHALKYIAIFLPLFLYGLWAVRKKPASRAALPLYVLAPAAVIALYVLFQHAFYGTYSPFAVSWARPLTGTQQDSLRFAGSVLFEIPLRDRLETLAGYFLDQRDGLLFYSPIFFFALLGAWEMFKKKRRELLLLLFLGGPYVLLSAFLTQRAGYAPQARPVVAVIWVMIIALGYFLDATSGTVFARLKNLAAGTGLVFVVLLLGHPLNLYQETTRGTTERGGGLFYLLSNLHFDLTRLLPSYLKVEDRSWLPNLVWPAILAVFVLAYALSKKKPVRLSLAGHAAAACAAVALFFVWFALFPRPVLVSPTRVKLLSGDRVTFYSLSRSARSVGPGRFLLREDGRSYRFYLTTDRPIAELGIDFGSEFGDYASSVRIFDERLLTERTVREVKAVRLGEPPGYKLGRKSLYGIILDIGKGTVAASDQRPYQFALDIRLAPGY